MPEIVTTEGYSPEEQAAYCSNYCIEGEHHPACAFGDPDVGPSAGVECRDETCPCHLGEKVHAKPESES